MDISDYLEPMGRDAVGGGSFANIFQYKYKKIGKLVAVKEIRKEGLPSSAEDHPDALIEVSTALNL